MSPSRRRTYVIDGISPVIDTAAFVHPDAVLIGDVVVGPENNWSQKSVLQTTASRPSKILFALPTYSVDRSIGQDYDEAGFKSDALVLNFGPTSFNWTQAAGTDIRFTPKRAFCCAE